MIAQNIQKYKGQKRQELTLKYIYNENVKNTPVNLFSRLTRVQKLTDLRIQN